MSIDCILLTVQQHHTKMYKIVLYDTKQIILHFIYQLYYTSLCLYTILRYIITIYILYHRLL
jgi:hypothetical protein